MLQYLLNATAIWLISLVVFDVFLRRETYHNYNRLYLLCTFVSGIVLPLDLWDTAVSLHNLPGGLPVQRISATRQTIVDTASASSLGDYINWWWLVYNIGFTVALAVLGNDVIKLVKMYRKSTRTYEAGLTIMETGIRHTPFSFRKTVFVENREKYNDTEWQTVIAHERRHATLLHFADVLMMQAARLVFWFHPLVYLYNNRLLTVHEYQADRESGISPQHYGRFLIEQALLQSAPALTHSFNRSPIKKRIIMLTRKSGAIAQLKMLVFIPLVLTSVICFSQRVIAKTFKADEYGLVKLTNSKFEYYTAKPDTIEVEEENGTLIKKVVKMDPYVIKMDGKAIEDARPVFKDNRSPAPYLFSKIKKELSALEDGYYNLGIGNVIVDEKGKTAAFTYQNILGDKNENSSLSQAKRDNIVVDKATEQKIFNSICNELSHFPTWLPPTVKNKKVVSSNNMFGDYWGKPTLKVQNHRVYFKEQDTWIAL